MIPQNIFRAYDIRGLYPNELNADVAELIGKGFGTYIVRNLDSRLHGNDRMKVVVGRDGRTHSPELHEAFVKGLTATGCQVTTVGLTPSPLLYFANTMGGFDAGCNITASHNPAEFNGFKLVAREGHAIYGEQIQEIYKIIDKGDFEIRGGSSPSAQNDTGKANFLDQYFAKIKSMFRFARPLKVVVDTGNGVAGAFYPKILRALGHEVIELFTELDGTFPNHEPDPIVEKNLTALKAKVLENKADLGLAFDGDGDRVGLVTEKGEFVSADRLLMLLTRDLLSRHPGATLVYTVSNSQVLFDLAREWGGKPVMCKVGHSYVENAMHEHHAGLGGEQSGHFFLPEDYYGFDDALVTACRILKIAADSGKPTSELFADFPWVFAEPEMRPVCPDDQKFKVLERIKAYFAPRYTHSMLDGIRLEFGEGAWAGIRVSNTSPCLSVILEAPTPAKLEEVKSVVLGHLKTYPEIGWSGMA